MYTLKAVIFSLTISVFFLTQISLANDKQSEETIDCTAVNQFIKNLESQIQDSSEMLAQINNPTNKLNAQYIKDYSLQLTGEISDLSASKSFYEKALTEGQCEQTPSENK